GRTNAAIRLRRHAPVSWAIRQPAETRWRISRIGDKSHLLTGTGGAGQLSVRCRCRQRGEEQGAQSLKRRIHGDSFCHEIQFIEEAQPPSQASLTHKDELVVAKRMNNGFLSAWRILASAG